jgi:hypothetical protein
MPYKNREDFESEIDKVWKGVSQRQDLIKLIDLMAVGVSEGHLESIQMASYLRGLAMALEELEPKLKRSGIPIEGESEWRLMGAALLDAFIYA